MAVEDIGPVVVPEEDAFDQDSSLGQDVASSTQTLSSSIIEYRRENGRTYHKYKDGKYNLPNDETENERLDLQHHIFLLTLGGKLGLSPPNHPDSKVKRVLDIGTGTGIWALDYADEHPEAEVIGVDLSPIQPSFVPPNVRFVVDDIDEEWSYPEPFDYIQSRMMNFSVEDWDEYFKNIFDNLTPGGHFEVQEVDVKMTSDDGSLTEHHALARWYALLEEASIKLGRPLQNFTTIRNAMRKAGFVDVQEAYFKWPTNRWPKDKHFKEIGAWNNENAKTLLGSATLAPFTRVLGWTREEVETFLVDVRNDLNDTKVHAYWPICFLHGRKPEV